MASALLAGMPFCGIAYQPVASAEAIEVVEPVLGLEATADEGPILTPVETLLEDEILVEEAVLVEEAALVEEATLAEEEALTVEEALMVEEALLEEESFLEDETFDTLEEVARF